MLKTVLAGTTALVIAGGGLAMAQPGPRADAPRWQPSAEDISAMVDARVAALKAGLRLTAEQEKHWPAVEAAIRELSKQRAALMAERHAARDANAPQTDVVTRMRQNADAMATRAAALKKLAEAADPLYKSLDDSQKQRFGILLRASGRPGMGPRFAAGPGFGDGQRFGHGPRFDDGQRFGPRGHRNFRGRDTR
jgi:hypothetical protein